MTQFRSNNKILSVQSFIKGRTTFVQLTLENGVKGFGEASYLEHPQAVCAILNNLQEDVRSLNPFSPDYNFHFFLQQFAYRDSCTMSALSALDQAYWDIKAQLLEIPIWELIGGKARDSVRAMIALWEADLEQLIAGVQSALKSGFSAFKIIPFTASWIKGEPAKMVNDAIDVIAETRRLIGKDYDLAIELHRDLDPGSALQFLNRVREFNPLFVEDPIMSYSVTANRAVAASANVPFALGERNYTVWEFQDYANIPNVQWLRADVGMAGGITQLRKIAALAESGHKKIFPHNFGGPITTANHIHLGVALPNLDLIEIAGGSVGKWLGADLSIVQNGYFKTSDKPGLGVKVAPPSYSSKSNKIQSRRPVALRPDGGLHYR